MLRLLGFVCALVYKAIIVIAFAPFIYWESHQYMCRSDTLCVYHDMTCLHAAKSFEDNCATVFHTLAVIGYYSALAYAINVLFPPNTAPRD